MKDLDWLDEDLEKTTIPAIYEIIFPIIEKNGYGDIVSFGTGFIITEGILISAGHVIGNDKNSYFAILDDGKELELTLLFRDYKDIEEQDGVICRDIALFKIDYHVDQLFTLSSNFQDKKSLTATGFKRYTQHSITLNYQKKGDFYIHDYKLQLGSCNEYVNLKGILAKEDIRFKSDNVCRLIIPDGIKFNGLSGGPIHDESFIYGLFVGDFFIKSEYIIEYLKCMII